MPAAFDYKLGEVIQVYFSDLNKTSNVVGLHKSIDYRILGVDESYDSDAIKFLRVLKLSDTDVIEKVIEEAIQTNTQKARHDNQDKIIRARTRGYEHMYLKHTCNLPLFLVATNSSWRYSPRITAPFGNIGTMSVTSKHLAPYSNQNAWRT